jgi:hypothetical protein
MTTFPSLASQSFRSDGKQMRKENPLKAVTERLLAHFERIVNLDLVLFH